jgi:hypothetical protein
MTSFGRITKLLPFILCSQEEDIENGNAMTSDRFKDLVYDFWVSTDPERYQFYTLMPYINVFLTPSFLIAKESTFAGHSIWNQLMNWKRRSKRKIEQNIIFLILILFVNTCITIFISKP